MLEELFCFPEIFGRPELIQMSKDTHDFGETVRLQDVQKLKGLHLKAKLGVDAKEDQVGNFGAIQHGGCIVRTFKEGHPLFLSSNDCDGTRHCRQILLRVEFDE